MDTILTVVLVFACIAMIALSSILIYDLSREFIEDQRAVKRRDELIKKWAELDLTHPLYTYTDTDFASSYPDTSIHNSYDYRNIWYRMQFSCQYCDLRYLRACKYKENERQPCEFECCPLLEDLKC